MMITCLSFAVMNRSSGMASPSLRRFCSGRYSIAKWMPRELAPGHFQIARRGRAAGEHTASNSRAQLVDRRR